MTDISHLSDALQEEKAKARVLLVDDQKIIAEAMKRLLADQPDISLYYCPNPSKAIDAAKEVKPTVILQDLIMPEVDGLTLVKFFRACPDTRDIPLVVLSSKEEPDVKYRAFENGANDYMVKFPDKLEVLARIRYHSRAYTTLCERNDAMNKLQQSQIALKKELDEAENYVTSLLPEKIETSDLSSDWIFKSSTELGGDCFGYGWIDSDRFAVYLLDVCGHGVGAALLSVSAMNALRSRTLSDVDFGKPDQVLSALNNAFEMERQNGMYFTLWYGVYDKSSRELSYASGGHPPAILVSGGNVRRLTTNGFIIGGMTPMNFRSDKVKVERGSKLYVFSDGVYEVEKPDGHTMSLDEFVAEIPKPARAGLSKVESMMAFSKDIQRSDSFEDDFSLCEIIFK